jgi:hypothetical protein
LGLISTLGSSSTSTGGTLTWEQLRRFCFRFSRLVSWSSRSSRTSGVMAHAGRRAAVAVARVVALAPHVQLGLRAGLHGRVSGVCVCRAGDHRAVRATTMLCGASTRM